jgi:polysaccharide pyruvyl transferase WcaK-like protein/SAM-dependent methyltransferase
MSEYSRKRFLITNSVPLNGGDEALLRALMIAITRRWPQSEIVVLCKDVERCRQQIPGIQFASDLEFAKTRKSRQNTIEHYRKADIVLSAPGGFLHDYYPLEDRLRGFELALTLSKPVLLVGQSIGPFFYSKSFERVREVLNRVSCICVRDEISRDHLLKCGVEASLVEVTADVAFLWRGVSPELFGTHHPKSEEKVIGLSFREWPLGDKKILKETIAKAADLCRYILDNPNRKILFLSTCQGIAGYVDDSNAAMEILQLLPQSLRARCEVDRSRYRPEELIRRLGQCDAYIGMRLHGCILAMMAGVPAFGLGYEDKTEQIYRQMGLESYQTRFDHDLNTWISRLDHFFAHVNEIGKQLPGLLDQRCAAAEANLDAVEKQLAKIPQSQAAPELRWSQYVGRYDRPHLRLRQVAALVNELHPKRMLDVGCATGYLRKLCTEVEYTGCDFVQPESPPDFSFHRCNFNREPLPDTLREFDVIVCSGILEYADDLPSFLSSLRSRLSAGGHLVFTYFNMNHISRIVALMRGRSFPVHRDWKGFYSPRDIRLAVESSGFHLVRSVAMKHTLRMSGNVEDTVSAPLRIRKAHWWSSLLANQLLYVAARTVEFSDYSAGTASK